MGISNPKTLRPLVYANCRAFCFSSQLKNATPSHLLDEPRRSDAAQLERDAESKDMWCTKKWKQLEILTIYIYLYIYIYSYILYVYMPKFKYNQTRFWTVDEKRAYQIYYNIILSNFCRKMHMASRTRLQWMVLWCSLRLCNPHQHLHRQWSTTLRWYAICWRLRR